MAAVEKRSETIAEEKLLLEKKLESKDEERVGLEREMAGAKAQLRTQQVEHEAVVVRPPPSASSCRSVINVDTVSATTRSRTCGIITTTRWTRRTTSRSG